jgi:signal transduction histidine kinase
MSTDARESQRNRHGDTERSDSRQRDISAEELDHRNSPAHHPLDVSRISGDNRTPARQLWKDAELLAQAERIGGIGTWELDIASRQMILSDNLCNLLGYPPGKRILEHEYWEFVHPADREDASQIVALAVRACSPYEYIARMRVVDGTVRSHFMTGLPLSNENGKVEKVIGLYRDVTNETHSKDELHKLTQQLMRARDDERRHMARELHESAGQTLAALKMTLARLEDEIPSDCEKGHALLRSSRELADAAVREVRTVSYLMHPPMLDEAGLYSALRWYARGFAERSQIRVDVDISEDFGRHSQEIETTIFRVVQEALTNVHRYSGSRTAAISVKRERESICVVIQDAGCGIPLTGSPGYGRITPGVGIAGMRERVLELEGSFHVDSVPGKGTTIRTVLPLKAGGGAMAKGSAPTKPRRSAQTNA